MCELKSPSPAPEKKKSSDEARRTREEIMTERVSLQYKQLQRYLRTCTPKPVNPFSRFEKSTSVPKSLESSQEDACKKLALQHRAAHEMIRKRLLRSAEMSLRLLLDSEISVDAARTELKMAMESYHHVVVSTFSLAGNHDDLRFELQVTF